MLAGRAVQGRSRHRLGSILSSQLILLGIPEGKETPLSPGAGCCSPEEAEEGKGT